MKVLFDLASRRARRIAVMGVLAGACLLPALAGAAPEQAETFDAQSRAGVDLYLAGDTASQPWVVRGDTSRAIFPQANLGYADAAAGSDTFSYVGNHHESHDGGGWVEHGGYGGDHGGDDGRGHGCDDGCVGTSAVPEPARAALTVTGLLVVVYLARRQRRSRPLVLAYA